MRRALLFALAFASQAALAQTGMGTMTTGTQSQPIVVQPAEEFRIEGVLIGVIRHCAI